MGPVDNIISLMSYLTCYVFNPYISNVSIGRHWLAVSWQTKKGTGHLKRFKVALLHVFILGTVCNELSTTSIFKCMKPNSVILSLDLAHQLDDLHTTFWSPSTNVQARILFWLFNSWTLKKLRPHILENALSTIFLSLISTQNHASLLKTYHARFCKPPDLC